MVAKVTSKYEDEAGDIHPIFLTPDSLAAAGAVPAGALTSQVKAKVSKSKREFGLGPRGVRISRTFGTAPDTFKKSRFIPVLTASAFGVTPFIVGATITYQGAAWTVTGTQPEDY